MFCSRTQYSDAGEAQTHGTEKIFFLVLLVPSFSSSSSLSSACFFFFDFLSSEINSSKLPWYEANVYCLLSLTIYSSVFLIRYSSVFLIKKILVVWI